MSQTRGKADLFFRFFSFNALNIVKNHSVFILSSILLSGKQPTQKVVQRLLQDKLIAMLSYYFVELIKKEKNKLYYFHNLYGQLQQQPNQ